MPVSVQPAVDAQAGSAHSKVQEGGAIRLAALASAPKTTTSAVAFKIGGRPERPSDSQLAEDDDRTAAEPAEID
jgi:hypothetical protein